jgi:hypothetical protein
VIDRRFVICEIKSARIDSFSIGDASLLPRSGSAQRVDCATARATLARGGVSGAVTQSPIVYVNRHTQDLLLSGSFAPSDRQALPSLQPKAPCVALSERHLQLLRTCSTRPISATPTNQEVYMALAALGGHLRSNGPPGWIVLGRAYEKLLLLERGWIAAQAAGDPISDRGTVRYTLPA